VEARHRDPRFDLRALVFGALGTAALSVGLAAALLHESRAHDASAVGPTSATLSDAFSAVAGAALGMLIGCAVVAGVCRSGSRFATGILAGFLAWLIGLVPAVVVTRASDVSVRDALGGALFVGALLILVALTGALVGAGIGVLVDRHADG
jgi:hypothetical protein